MCCDTLCASVHAVWVCVLFTHFALLMDLCHLKSSELEPQFQKYKGRVALRGDIVKDDSGSYAVFTEQRDHRHHKCQDAQDKQQADAVSAYTQVKMEDAPSLWKKSEVRMSKYLETSSETQRAQNHGPVWKTQSFPLNEICTVILWQDYDRKGNSRKFY